MTSLQHAVGFLQTAYTFVLALALTEGFKQFIDDNRERNIFWDRSWALTGFLFLIFPFFHGMSRYFFKTYLEAGKQGNFAGYLMFDGIAFMCMSACFFIMSRSLSPDRWQRYYGALACLLVADSVWIGVALTRGVTVIIPWLWLNGILAVIMVGTYVALRRKESSIWPHAIAAMTIIITTVISYLLMSDFYFS